MLFIAFIVCDFNLFFVLNFKIEKVINLWLFFSLKIHNLKSFEQQRIFLFWYNLHFCVFLVMVACSHVKKNEGKEEFWHWISSLFSLYPFKKKKIVSPFFHTVVNSYVECKWIFFSSVGYGFCALMKTDRQTFVVDICKVNYVTLKMCLFFSVQCHTHSFSLHTQFFLSIFKEWPCPLIKKCFLVFVCMCVGNNYCNLNFSFILAIIWRGAEGK